MPVIDINMSEFVELIREYCPDPKCIVEIGSMDGKDSIFFKDTFPDAVVFAIEGLPDNYEIMRRYESINCIQAVVSDEDGEIIFHVKNINGLHGMHDRGSIYGTKKIRLPCHRFDSTAREYFIPEADVLKIDVEGATFNVLKGMGERLDKVKIMHIETESYPFFEGQALHDEVSIFLEDKRFCLVEMSKAKINENGYQHDSVWVAS